MTDTDNGASIVELTGGLCALNLSVVSKIANPKRRSVLAELALRHIAELELEVAAMSYEEVERVHEKLKPVNATNGHNELRDVITADTIL